MPCVADLVFIGIDPASTKVAFMALYGDAYMVEVHQRLGKSGGQSCANAWHVTKQFVEAVRVAFPDTKIVATIESAVVGRGGVRTTMVQCYTAGAIMGALHDEGIVTQIANVSSWKKRVVGRGNATKEDVSKWLRLRWPDFFSATRGNQDLVDATCIALYGQQVYGERMV